MLVDEKLIPKSRIAPVARTSREFMDRVIRELREEGLINPLRTATGRDLLSFSECQVIWGRLGHE